MEVILASLGLSVHIHNSRLDLGDEALSRLERTLSPDERFRAGRFRFRRDRDRFVVARGLLREILAGYLALQPDELLFAYGDKGKPALAGNHAAELTFNLSHSGEMMAVAIGRTQPVGIDIERVEPHAGVEQMAQRFLSPLEFEAVRDAPSDCRNRVFLAFWTRKEAYLKATELGLSGLEGNDSKSGWHFREFEPAPGYLGAIAIFGECEVLFC